MSTDAPVTSPSALTYEQKVQLGLPVEPVMTDPVTAALRERGVRGDVTNPQGVDLVAATEPASEPEAGIAIPPILPRVPITMTLREAFAFLLMVLACCTIPVAGFLIGVTPTNVYTGLFATGGLALVMSVLLGLS